MLRRTANKKGQEGQALLETTLMLMVTLLLLMGIIQFGFLFYAYVRVSNATREGARAGSLWLMRQSDSTLCEQVEGGVTAEVGCITAPTEPGQTKNCDIAITLEDGPVDCVNASPVAGDPITVTVTYDFALPVVSGLPIIRDVVSSPYPVTRTVVMRFQ